MAYDLPKMTPEDATKGTPKKSYSRPRFKNDQTQRLLPKNYASSISTMIGGSSNWWIGGGLERVHSSESASTTFTISSSPSLAGGAVLLKRWAVATTAVRGAAALRTVLSAKGATFDTAERSMVLVYSVEPVGVGVGVGHREQNERGRGCSREIMT